MLYQGEVLSGLYQIEDEIGRGGTGIIYRAYHLNLQKYVVVKKIKDHFTGVLNVRGEADILKSLHHTCLPQVYDFLQVGSGIYTVMDYIAGYDMKYYIDQGTHFDEALLLYWMTQLGEVLSYLHAHGILHLDIKPANIMVTEEGNVCLIDFNISLADDKDELQGITEAYASPEQCRKYEGLCHGTKEKEIVLDERADIYSLGASFYHLMSGVAPLPAFAGKSRPLSAFGLPYSKDFTAVIDRMMQYLPQKRYRSADQCLNALLHIQRGRAEKRTLHTVFFGMLGGIVILAVLCGVILYRGQTVGSAAQQQIQKQEIRLEELNVSGEYETARQEGIVFLNTHDKELLKLPGARESILEKIVDACIGTGAYAEAETYLDELIKRKEKAQYYESRACIAAYTGDYKRAQTAIEQAQALGGDKEGIQKSKAELEVAQGNYAKAIEIYQAVFDGQETTVLRRMAYLALQAAKTDESYAASAQEYYKNLAAKGKASFADQMNLVSAYCMCGMDEKALEWLKGMRASFAERYDVYLELGVLEYNAQLKKNLASRDFTKTKEYVKEARRLYEKEHPGETDERLEELAGLTDEY